MKINNNLNYLEMKINFRTLIKYSAFAMVAILFLASCSEDNGNEEPVLVEDGIYVTGEASGVDALNIKGKLSKTNNEVTQEQRASLYEIYIALEAGKDFTISHVNGASTVMYGPGADFASSSVEWETDEPDTAIQRGSYTESETAFSVPLSGLYHIALDTDLEQMAIAPVHWGVIGGATPDGWGGSTALTSSGFDKTTMSFTISDLELRGGDWKFRYSNGWKIDLDTVVDLGGGDKGVKVNTNFGGSIDALVAGGDNIVNNDPGVYSITLTWTLGSGHSATVTKTGDLPLTNWEGVLLDAVGDGISGDNANASADASSWNWGNVILADNNGEPTKDGDKYTWTWTNVVLEADQGFKIRTKDGVAPASGGANFDAGLESTDLTNSSANVKQEDSGNLEVTVKAAYDITIVIDAADSDSKTITIVDHP